MTHEVSGIPQASEANCDMDYWSIQVADDVTFKSPILVTLRCLQGNHRRTLAIISISTVSFKRSHCIHPFPKRGVFWAGRANKPNIGAILTHSRIGQRMPLLVFSPEPCWQFSWQSAKVGAAWTNQRPKQISMCQLTASAVCRRKRHLDMSPKVLLHTCIGEAPSRAAPFSLPAGARLLGRASTARAGTISCLLMSPWLLSSDRLRLNASRKSRASKSLMTPFLLPLPGNRASVCPTLPLLLPSALHWSPFTSLIGSSCIGTLRTLHLELWCVRSLAL